MKQSAADASTRPNIPRRRSTSSSRLYFLLSPAGSVGVRAQMVMRPQASLDLARRLREQGATLAEVLTFVSGLYFRGKIEYARRFVRPLVGDSGVYVISAGRGLVDAQTIVQLAD